MKKYYLIFSLTLFYCAVVYAQSPLDEDVNRLIRSLGQDEKSDDKAYQHLREVFKQRDAVFLKKKTWQGDLEVMVVDRASPKGEMSEPGYIYHLNTQNESAQLFFLYKPPLNIEMARRVSVSGIKSENRILVEKITLLCGDIGSDGRCEENEVK